MPDVAEARILVDGVEVGSGPIEVEVEHGEHSFRAEAEGFPAAEQTLQVKRDAEVKDAGALLPGMGGILDRIDAPLLGIPVTYYLMLFYVWLEVG